MFLAFLLSLALEEPKTAQIDVRYENLSAEAQADFENAVAVWERCLVSDAPIKIVASSIKRGPTGFANHNSVRNKRYLPKRGVWYPTALASALRGRRVTEQDDMNVFLKEAGDGDNWHFSQDDPISEGKVDFINVAMHEIAHGLGVSSVIFVPWEGEPIASIGRPDEFVDFFEWSFPFREQDGTPEVYDTFLKLADGRRITKDFPEPSLELTYAVANPTIHFDGKHAVAANGGYPVGVTPLNVSHIPAFPRRATPIMLADSGQGESIRHPDKILLGMLRDLGWTITDACFERGA
ncbi:MAG: hypothetical protein HRU11_07685 [Parvularculaceae bacterium]|nr:hypothetical protein [Parvularculaceae bacterium]